MPIRDMLLAILLIFNVYFAYTVYNLNTKNEKEVSEISYSNYATLYMFKEILPADTFKEILLPEIEVAFEDGIIDDNEWGNLKLKIEDLKKSSNIDFRELCLQQMKKEDLGSTLEKMLGDWSDDVDAFGGTLKQEIKEFVEKRSDAFSHKDDEDDDKPTISNPTPKKEQNTNEGVAL